ncbi:hypothetical protein [Saccharomonospora halophila]|uniref:hypothetical protein n=1 Tax=Saccharomonospora halophila TaxID=129922 RepID=UPI00039F389F|nr:hypothetical protein [Saccharomonospora halophila]
MSFDASAHSEAERLFTFALACAEEADNWPLRALILGNMAQQSVWLGDPQTGLTHTDLALVRADRLPATHLARLHTMRARVFAAMHRMEETRTAVGTADEHLDNSRPDDDPIYLAHDDPAEHNAVAGEALASLAAPTGHGTAEATRRLTDSIHGYGPAYTRFKPSPKSASPPTPSPPATPAKPPTSPQAPSTTPTHCVPSAP